MSDISRQDLVDLIETAAKSAVQRSLVETIVPIIRHGTVIDTDIDTFILEVQMDGDSTTIQAHDILQFGSYIGARVTVLFAPPHQAMIIGQPIHDLWHQVGAVDDVPFTIGWGNDPTSGDLDTDTFPQCSYRRRGNWVEVRGSALRTSGTSDTFFTLPESYRPRNDITLIGVNTLTGHELVVVERTGQVAHPSGGNGPVFFSLSFGVS